MNTEEIRAWFEKTEEIISIELTRREWDMVTTALLMYRTELLGNHMRDLDTKPLRDKLGELYDVIEKKRKEE